MSSAREIDEDELPSMVATYLPLDLVIDTAPQTSLVVNVASEVSLAKTILLPSMLIPVPSVMSNATEMLRKIIIERTL